MHFDISVNYRNNIVLLHVRESDNLFRISKLSEFDEDACCFPLLLEIKKISNRWVYDGQLEPFINPVIAAIEHYLAQYQQTTANRMQFRRA